VLPHSYRRTIFLGAPTGTIRPLTPPSPQLHPKLYDDLNANIDSWVNGIHRFLTTSDYSPKPALHVLATLLAGPTRSHVLRQETFSRIFHALTASQFYILGRKLLDIRKNYLANRKMIRLWIEYRHPKDLSRDVLDTSDIAQLAKEALVDPMGPLVDTCLQWARNGPSALDPHIQDPDRWLQPLWVHEAARRAQTINDAVGLIERFHCKISSFSEHLQSDPSVQAMFIGTAKAADLLEWMTSNPLPVDPALRLLISSRTPDLCEIVDPLCLVPFCAHDDLAPAINQTLQNTTTVNMRSGQRAPSTCVVLDTSYSLGLGAGYPYVSRAKAVAATALRLRGKGTLYFIGSSFRDLPNDLITAEHRIQDDWAGCTTSPKTVLDVCTAHKLPFSSFVFIGDQTEYLRDDPQWTQRVQRYREGMGLDTKIVFISVSATTRCMRPVSDPRIAEIKGVLGSIPRMVFDFSTSWDRCFSLAP